MVGFWTSSSLRGVHQPPHHPIPRDPAKGANSTSGNAFHPRNTHVGSPVVYIAWVSQPSRRLSACHRVDGDEKVRSNSEAQCGVSLLESANGRIRGSTCLSAGNTAIRRRTFEDTSTARVRSRRLPRTIQEQCPNVEDVETPSQDFNTERLSTKNRPPAEEDLSVIQKGIRPGAAKSSCREWSVCSIVFFSSEGCVWFLVQHLPSAHPISQKLAVGCV